MNGEHPISVVLPDGSMEEPLAKLFARAGLPITVGKRRTKEGTVPASWIKRVAFQRPQEIPHYLNAGYFDSALVGEDWIANWGYQFPILLKLPIGRGGSKPVKIVVAVSKESGIKRVEDLPDSCGVATEYVKLTERFFAERERRDVRILASFGNTEHKIRFGATAIVDVAESGTSLVENGLEIIAEIMESSTILVANPLSLENETKRFYLDCLSRLIKGAHHASECVILTANVPKKALGEAAEIIGGLKGPSSSPVLGANGWFALKSVIPKETEQEVIFKLLRIGVTDIIVDRDAPLVMT